MQTVVINNKEALVIGQMPHSGKDKSGVPQLGGIVTLIPGVNLVDTKVLKTLRENPGFELLFKTKIESSQAPEQNPEKVGKCILIASGEVEDSSPLAKLPPKACEAMIEETLSSDLLNKWLEDETRGDVRRVLFGKIKKLEGSPAPSGGPAAVGR